MSKYINYKGQRYVRVDSMTPVIITHRGSKYVRVDNYLYDLEQIKTEITSYVNALLPKAKKLDETKNPNKTTSNGYKLNSVDIRKENNSKTKHQQFFAVRVELEAIDKDCYSLHNDVVFLKNIFIKDIKRAITSKKFRIHRERYFNNGDKLIIFVAFEVPLKEITG